MLSPSCTTVIEDQFSTLPSLKPVTSKKIKLIANPCYLWKGDYLPIAYPELVSSKLSTIFNNKASQREAAFIKMVKQGSSPLCSIRNKT